MPLDDVNALEYSCFALDQPIDLDWLGLDEPSGLSHTTLQSDLNTAQAIQQAEEDALHDDLDYGSWLQDGFQVLPGLTQNASTGHLAATEPPMDNDDDCSSSANGLPRCDQSLPGVLEQWHQPLYLGDPAKCVERMHTMNHLRLDARQRGDLMGDRIVELASVNAPPTSRASITSGSSELIFAEASLSRHDESGLGQGMVATNSVLPKHVSAHLGHMNRWNNTMDAYSTARNVPITRLEPKWKRSTNGSLGPDSCIFSNLATTNGDTHSSHVPTLSVQSYSDAASTRPWRGGRRQLPPNDRTVRQSLPGPLPGASVTSYYCTDTDCRKFFSKKSEWKRHEAEVHFAPVFWVCNLNRIIGPSVSRYFVSGSTPACQHTDSGCQKCPASGRKFARKREIKRHLTKWHDMTKQGAGRYVEDEMNYKDMSYQELFCFVCRETCHDWDSRARHIAEHFEDGVTKAKWEAGREAYHAATA